MHQFNCPDLPDKFADDLSVQLDAKQTHHARNVIRLRESDTVGLFRGDGIVAEATITTWPESKRGTAELSVTKLTLAEQPKPSIILAVAIPKGSHADTMIGQLSQVGADDVNPMTTEHSIVDPRPTKLKRFADNAIESAKQCGRSYLMNVHDPISFEDALALEADLKLLAAPGVGDSAAIGADAERLLILVGPEGGWHESELSAATDVGFARWDLGPHIMRIETAAVAACAIARYLTRSPL